MGEQKLGNSPSTSVDAEWLTLILLAKELGLTKEEVRSFLESQSSDGYAVS